MEELETLAAIYPELEYDTDTLSGSLEITASFEEPVKVVFGDADTQHEIRNLPPVLLFLHYQRATRKQNRPSSISSRCG